MGRQHKQPPLAMTALRANIVTTPRESTAWFVLPSKRWSFRTDAERVGIIDAVAQRYAALVDHDLHLRVTTRPWSPQSWRTRMTSGDRAPINPRDGWDDFLRDEETHMRGMSFVDKTVFLGVTLTPPLAGFARYLGRNREWKLLQSELVKVEAAVAGPGLEGRPCRQDELEWLVRRSVSLGFPVAQSGPVTIQTEWAKEDIRALNAPARWTCEAYDRTVKVVADVAGRTVERHVCTTTVGRIENVDMRDPWLARTDRLGFPVEVTGRVRVVPASKVIAAVRRQLLRIRYQVKHWMSHDQEAPVSLQKATERGRSVQQAVDRGMTGLETRVESWWEIVVVGRTPAEAIDRARQVEALYAPKIDMVRSDDQYLRARSAIPGERRANDGYKRHLSVRFVAAAMPQKVEQVGHRDGFYLGYTSSGASRRPVLWDMHRAMEIDDRSGLTVVAAQPGAGKSTLLGMLIIKAALAGVLTVALDPAGPLARLCQLPELRSSARHIDLMSAQPGILSPYRVIPDPVREYSYDRDGNQSDDVWHRDIVMAEAARQQLCLDMMLMYLPQQYRGDEYYRELDAACSTIPGHITSSARAVVNTLATGNQYAATLARTLDRISNLPAAQLVFPSGYNIDLDAIATPGLTVITAANLVTPDPATAREDWTADERMSVPVLHAAAYETQRTVYQRDPRERKLVPMDEAHIFDATSAGKAFVMASSRYSRKHNARVVLASQAMSDMLSGPAMSNLIDSKFIGQTEGPEAQAAAVATLRIPEQYTSTFATLQQSTEQGPSGQREFVFADGTGAIERIHIDTASLPVGMLEAISTTPDAHEPSARERISA